LLPLQDRFSESLVSLTAAFHDDAHGNVWDGNASAIFMDWIEDTLEIRYKTTNMLLKFRLKRAAIIYSLVTVQL